MVREVQPATSTQPVRYDLDLNGLRDSTYWPVARLHPCGRWVGAHAGRHHFDDTGHEIGEYDGAGRLLRRLLRHPDFEAPLGFADAAGTLSFAVTDRLGSMVATVSSADACDGRSAGR